MVWYKEDPVLTGKAVVYSLVIFISNQRKPKTDGGSIVRIELIKRENKVSVSNAGFYLTWVYTPIVKYRKKFYILPCSQFENKVDFFEKQTDYLMMKKFINDSRRLLYEQNLNVGEYIYNGTNWLLIN